VATSATRAQPDSTDDTRIRPVFPLARWNPAQ